MYVLPTTTKPPPDILELFKSDDSAGKRFLHAYANGVDTLKEKPHTLEEYAMEHFRPPPKRTISKSLTLSSARKGGREELWRHSREPIRQPLLKKLQNKEGVAEEACFVFTSALKYMGDIPHKRSKIGNELTDQIFDPPLKQVCMIHNDVLNSKSTELPQCQELASKKLEFQQKSTCQTKSKSLKAFICA